MKLKSLLIALFALVALGAPARAAYNNAISVDPISFLVDGIFNATYEFRTAPKNSVALSLAYESYTIGHSAFDYEETWSSLVIQGQYRWFLPLGDNRKVPLEGFSLGPWAAVAYRSYDVSSGSSSSTFDNGTSFLIGGEAAYKWVFDGFVLEPNLGFGFSVNKISGYTKDSRLYGGVKLGYGW